MRIEFDPTNPTEAAAVRAMLTSMAAPETPRVVKPYVANEHLVITSTADTDPRHQVTTIMSATGDTDPIKVPEGNRFSPAVTDDPSSLVNCDSNGEPHDPRIHSTPPKLNADGTWRAKRGVTAEQIAEVRAEREAQTTEVASIVASFEEPVTAPLVEPAVSAPATPPAPPANAPSSTPTPAPTPPAPPVPAGTNAHSFLDVMKAITAAQKDGKIDTAKVKELCAAVGAGESTMGLNGPDNGDKRVAFMALLASEVAA